MGTPHHTPEVDRLWSRIVRTDGCWEWPGARNTKGYGVIRTCRDRVARTFPTHRLAWESANGPIPTGMFVCHRCDNPPCCNPAHLYLGSPADNTHDRDSRGRNGKSKVTAEQVRELRRRRMAGEKLAALSRDYGLSISQVSGIAHGRDWRNAA